MKRKLRLLLVGVSMLAMVGGVVMLFSGWFTPNPHAETLIAQWTTLNSDLEQCNADLQQYIKELRKTPLLEPAPESDIMERLGEALERSETLIDETDAHLNSENGPTRLQQWRLASLMSEDKAHCDRMTVLATELTKVWDQRKEAADKLLRETQQ